MLFVFSPLFVANTKMIFGYNFVATVGLFSVATFYDLARFSTKFFLYLECPQ